MNYFYCLCLVCMSVVLLCKLLFIIKFLYFRVVGDFRYVVFDFVMYRDILVLGKKKICFLFKDIYFFKRKSVYCWNRYCKEVLIYEIFIKILNVLL